MSMPPTRDSSLSWRGESTLSVMLSVVAMPITSRDWPPSDLLPVLWVIHWSLYHLFHNLCLLQTSPSGRTFYMHCVSASRTTESVAWLSTSVRTSWAVRASLATTIPPSRPWAGATMKLALSGSSLERECLPTSFLFPSHLFFLTLSTKISLVTLSQQQSYATPHVRFLLCRDFSTDLCATSTLVIVDTSISWSVIVTVGSTNTSGSLAPTARPLRSSPSAVFSSNNLLQTLSPMSPLTPAASQCWINCLS